MHAPSPLNQHQHHPSSDFAASGVLRGEIRWRLAKSGGTTRKNIERTRGALVYPPQQSPATVGGGAALLLLLLFHLIAVVAGEWEGREGVTQGKEPSSPSTQFSANGLIMN